jgi:prepilin-type N-terminal cleavage/methylation domain-containing protein
MTIKSTKKGFTLVELLIATAVFAIFLTAIISFMVDLYRNSRRIELEEQLYQDMRALMRQITVMVESNAIDYEEYFRAATGDLVFGNGDGSTYSYGDYAKQFYDFRSGGPGPNGEGALCNDGIKLANPDCIVDKTTLDKNLGKKEDNAFCGEGTSLTCPLDEPGIFALHQQDNLYLINGKGTRKTFLATEPVTRELDSGSIEERVLSVFWMNGSDADGNDVTDTWDPGLEFNVSDPADLAKDLVTTKSEQKMYSNFIPISPLRSNIVNLKFYISPLEDPYKAFAETDPATGTLMQPHVTVILTMEPSAVEMQNYLGEIPSKTLQTTIYSDIQQEVRSY